MWIFKKKIKNELSSNAPSITDKVASKIVVQIMKIQLKFAEIMNRLFSSMTIKKIKLNLIFFSLITGGYSVYLIINAIATPEKKQKVYTIEKLALIKNSDKTSDEFRIKGQYIDDATFDKIRKFKKYMDSLKINKSFLYDSIVAARPLLMDSISILEDIYNSQKQK